MHVQDPSNKRYVISDDALQQLTGESRFLAFGAQKLFGKHFPKGAAAVPEPES
jgi:hypothetical protein